MPADWPAVGALRARHERFRLHIELVPGRSQAAPKPMGRQYPLGDGGGAEPPEPPVEPPEPPVEPPEPPVEPPVPPVEPPVPPVEPPVPVEPPLPPEPLGPSRVVRHENGAVHIGRAGLHCTGDDDG